MDKYFVNIIVILIIYIFATLLSNALIHCHKTNNSKNTIKTIATNLILICCFFISCVLTIYRYIDQNINIEITYCNSLNYNDTITLQANFPYVNIYYTVDGKLVKTDGILYQKPLCVREICPVEKNQIVYISYQAKLLDYFWVGEAKDKEFKIEDSKITPVKLISQKVKQFPEINTKELKQNKNIFFYNIDIKENGKDIKNDLYKFIIDGNPETIFRFSSNSNCEILFSNSNKKGFQKIYLQGGFYIDKIMLITDNESYEFIFPYIENKSTVVEMDLGQEIYTENLRLVFYSNCDTNTIVIGDIWIDNYVE